MNKQLQIAPKVLLELGVAAIILAVGLGLLTQSSAFSLVLWVAGIILIPYSLFRMSNESKSPGTQKALSMSAIVWIVLLFVLGLFMLNLFWHSL